MVHMDIFFMILYVIQKIVGNDNYPYSLNKMVNYHYHGEYRVIWSRVCARGAEMQPR